MYDRCQYNGPDKIAGTIRKQKHINNIINWLKIQQN